METQDLFRLWQEARTRFANQLPAIQAADLGKKLPGCPNSVGFLLRHIAEVELLFAKNVFGKQDVYVVARTVIDKRDTGEWTGLEDLMNFLEQSHSILASAIQGVQEGDWKTEVSTKEFGTKTKAEALGRIISHTAYHAGQMAMTLRYGA